MNKLSDGEWKLMELLWEESPVNSTRLVERCRERLTWSKSTTYTGLRRLCRNGAAVNEGAVVSPKLGREEALRAHIAAACARIGDEAFLSGGVERLRQVERRNSETARMLLER